MSEKTDVAAPAVEEAKVELTIAEITGEQKVEAKVVPEAVFLEQKNENKELKRELKAIRAQIEGGATQKEVSASLNDIAEEYGTDPKFLGKLASAIRADVEKENEAKLGAALKPFQEKERAQQVKGAFDTHFEKSMGDMEDYKGIVNKDVIFALSLNPNNAQKTIPQLIEETYGNAIAGKRSVETTTHRASTTPGVLDFDRANTDAEYLGEVMKDPALKKQFHDKAQEIARRG